MKSLVEHLNESMLVEAKENLQPKTVKSLATVIKNRYKNRRKLYPENPDYIDLNDIDISKVKHLEELFVHVGPVVSNVTFDMNKWDVSHINSLRRTFRNVSAKVIISDWDVSNVRDMTETFSGAFDDNESESPDISKWDVSNVSRMIRMFADSGFSACGFDGDISNWDVSNVNYFDEMFYGNRKFNCDLNKWKLNKTASEIKDTQRDMFTNSKLAKNPPKWYIGKTTKGSALDDNGGYIG